MYLRNSLLFISILILTSCGFAGQDPVKKYNRIFLKNYGNRITKPMERHKKIAKENNIYYDGQDRIGNLITRDTLRKELNEQFLKNYINNFEDVEKKTVAYNNENHGPFFENKKTNYKYYDKFLYLKKNTLNNKKFNSIDYNTLQVNYDYVKLIKKLQYQDFLEAKAIQDAIQPTEEKTGIIDKIQDVGGNILDKFKNLFKK